MVDDLILLVKEEMKRAEKKHQPFHSAVERIAVIREEYLEVEREIFWRSREAAVEELIQLTGVCVKLLQFYLKVK